MNAVSKSQSLSKQLDELHHPLREEIELLRDLILSADARLQENFKWNGPNYTLNAEDRITMRIQPVKQIQLVFHRGAKVLAQPPGRLIDDSSGLLQWKANDRAVVSFKNKTEITKNAKALDAIVKQWLQAASV